MSELIKKGLESFDSAHTSRGEMEDHVTRRWELDNLSDSWLTKSSRHIIAIFLTVSLVIGWFMKLEITAMSGLTGTVLTALFGARTYEKVRKIDSTNDGRAAQQERHMRKLDIRESKVNARIERREERRSK